MKAFIVLSILYIPVFFIYNKGENYIADKNYSILRTTMGNLG